jgi:hypothetical protein
MYFYNDLFFFVYQSAPVTCRTKQLAISHWQNDRYLYSDLFSASKQKKTVKSKWEYAVQQRQCQPELSLTEKSIIISRNTKTPNFRSKEQWMKGENRKRKEIGHYSLSPILCSNLCTTVLNMCTSVCFSVRLPVCLPVPMCLCVCFPVCQHVCLPVCLSVYLNVPIYIVCLPLSVESWLN